MAFPAVATTATTNGTTATASPVVNLPASIAAGDLLLVLHRAAGNAAGVGWPAGWTELFDDTADGSNDQTALAWRKADGTEGSTITLSQGSHKFATIAWRITGAADPTVQAPEFATLVTGASTTPDPGSLSPTGGAKDFLWLWMGGWEGEQTSPPASNPTNYASNILGADSGVAGNILTNCCVASASRNLNAASEDPGSWTISVSDDWTATVVAVHPASVEGAALEAAVSGVASVAAALTTSIALAAALSGTAAVAADLTTAIRPAASVTATATTVGDLTTEIRLAGALTGTATATAAFPADAAQLVAAVTGSGAVAGDLTTQISLRVGIGGGASAEVAGDLTTQITPAASITGTASVAGNLSTQITPAASVTGQANVAGDLTTAIQMAGAITGQATASGELEGGAAALVASASGTSTASGDLSTAIACAASVSASSSASSVLSTQIALAGALSGTATMAGEITVDAVHYLAPPERTFIVPQQRRRFEVPRQERRFIVPQQRRRFEVK